MVTAVEKPTLVYGYPVEKQTLVYGYPVEQQTLVMVTQ